MKEISTPAFLVDRDRVTRNCDRMRVKAAASEVAFRPHAKTHKTVEGARLQHGGAVGPITVSTLAEAEFFAAAGFDDITYAVPIAPAKVARAAALQRTIRSLTVIVDSHEAVRALEEDGSGFTVFLKIDCGYHRAGVDPSSEIALRLADALLSSQTLRFGGFLTHAGHSYDARSHDEVLEYAAAETSAVNRIRERLGSRGAALTRSIGSTPTCSAVDRFSDCDEVRPGNYIFYDAFQSTIGSCTFDDVAVSVLTTVIGSYPDRGGLIIDAAALALSKDVGANHVDPDVGYGIVCDSTLRRLPLRIRALSQEHGKVEGAAEVIASLPVGSRLRVVPNHSCLTAAMFDRYYVIEGERVVAEWRPVRGW